MPHEDPLSTCDPDDASAEDSLSDEPLVAWGIAEVHEVEPALEKACPSWEPEELHEDSPLETPFSPWDPELQEEDEEPLLSEELPEACEFCEEELSPPALEPESEVQPLMPAPIPELLPPLALELEPAPALTPELPTPRPTEAEPVAAAIEVDHEVLVLNPISELAPLLAPAFEPAPIPLAAEPVAAATIEVDREVPVLKPISEPAPFPEPAFIADDPETIAEEAGCELLELAPVSESLPLSAPETGTTLKLVWLEPDAELLS